MANGQVFPSGQSWVKLSLSVGEIAHPDPSLWDGLSRKFL